MLGDNIKECRKKCSLGQVELAKKMKVANGTISMWENNLRVPDINAILELSKIFQVSIDELVGNESFIKKVESNELMIPDEKKATVELLIKLPAVYYANIEGQIQAYATIANIR